MKAVAIIGPKFRAWDPDTNLPLAGGKLYTYVTGTTTNKATYQDEGQAATNTNPVILDANGEADVYLDGSYALVLKNSADVTVWSRDPVSDASQLGQEWINQSAATQYSATQFEVVGNKTGIFTTNRRVKMEDATTLYGRVSGAIYTGGNTRVTVDVDGGASITASLSSVWVSTVTSDSLPDLFDRTFPNVAAMVANGALEVGDLVRTLGYFSAGDGGENEYQIVAAGTGADDGGTYINLTGISGQAKGLFTHKRDVKQFGANNLATDLTQFQAAIDSTPNSGVQIIDVAPGTYQGDMTTLTWGSRDHVIFREAQGPVTYSTAAPVTRQYQSSTGLIRIDANDTAAYVPMGVRAELTLSNTHVSGNPWTSLFTLWLNATTGSNENSAIVARAINNGGSDDNLRAIDAVGRDTTEGSVEYGAPYPITPQAHNGAVIAYEGNTFRTNVFDESGKRGIGLQLTAGGGTECANGIEISATQNTAARTHDGTAQAGAAGSITLAATANPNDTYYNNSLVVILSGTGAGQVRKINSYVGSTKVASVDVAWATPPDATSTYLVYDSYWTGLWRRGIKIWENALNALDGVGLYVQSACKYGVLVEGNTVGADFAVSRTSANLAKLKTSVGVTTGSIIDMTFNGGDSAGASSNVTYGQIQAVITDNTAGAHAGEIRIEPVNGGALNSGYYVKVGNGVQVGSPTGGYKGAGTINAAGDIYKNNAAYTNPDYVFEKEYTGEIVVFADNEGAKDYHGRLSLDELRAYTMETLRLPGITDEAMGAFKRSDLVLEKLEELTLYILDLHDRIRELEAKQ